MNRRFLTLELTREEIENIINSLEFSDNASEIGSNPSLINEIREQLKPRLEAKD
jgi:hypothetical protein